MNEFDKAAAQVAGTSPDPIEAAASQVVQGERTALRSSLYNSLLENPDVAARAVQLGRQTGLPADVVQRNLPEVQRNVALDEFDKVLENSPTVAKWLTEQNNAAIAHDDAQNLTALDSVLGFFRNTGSAAVSGLQRASAGVVGLAQAPFDVAAQFTDPLVGTILPANPFRAPANALSRYRQGIEATAKGNMPEGEGNIESGFYSGIASLSTNLAALPLAFLPGGQGAALTAMTAPVAGGEFGKARDAGLSPLAAVSFGASQGAIEYATERLPLARLIGDVKVGTPFFKTLARQAALEVPGEQLATVLQDLNDWAVLNPDKPFSSYLAERPSAAAQTLVATLVGVGGQVTVAKGIETAVQRFTQQADAADQADRTAGVLGELDKLAAASKVRGRDATSFEQFVEQATEDGPVQDVYIAADVLNQSGVLEQLAEVSPSVREQFATALATGADVRIPVAEYTARIAGTELNQGLLDHLKIEPGGFSRAEAQEFMQSQAQVLEEEVQKVLAVQEEADQFRAGIDEVKGQVKTQLDQVGRFTGNVNEAYSTLMGNFFGVMAAKLGVSPQELYARYTPRFQAESVAGGQVLEQGAVDTPEFRNWFGESKVADTQGKPQVVYHGTNQSFDTFSPEFYGEATGTGDLGDGFYFTDRGDVASSFAGDGDGANVMPVYLSIKNPATNAVINSREVQDILDDGMGFTDLSEYLKDQGYDGIIYTHQDGGTEYVVFDPEQIKSATGNRGTFDPNDANILNQFAGESTQTADVYSLIDAKERIEKGQSAELVRRQTGWFQGADGLWRFEISDDQAKWNNSELVTEEDVAKSLEGQIEVVPDPTAPGLFKALYGQNTVDYRAAFGKTEDEAKANLVRALAKMFNAGKFDPAKMSNGDEFKLADILNHPKLFAAYPDLRNMTVTFESGVDYRGVYNPRSDRIGIAVSSDSDQMLSTLLHEIQHAIQQREGFAKGGNTDTDFVSGVRAALKTMTEQAQRAVDRWIDSNQDKISDADKASRVVRYSLMWESANRLLDYSRRDTPSGVFRLIRNEMQWIYSDDMRGVEEAQELQRSFYGIPRRGPKRNQVIRDMAFRAGQLLRDSVPSELREQFENDPRTVKGMLNALQREASKKSKALRPLTELRRTQRNAQTVADAHRFSGSFEIYQALAGEVEARNTQARLQMTDEQRAVTPPQATADVPLERVIVMMGGLNIRAPMAAIARGDLLQKRNDAARGSFNPATNTITLLKNADLSTFLHESGHFFLEVQFDIAARLQQEAAVFGAETNKPGEQAILRDTNAVLQWFGLRDLAEWNSLDFEEKRSYHERFARGFEAYLFEGQAPSIELQKVFQTFRTWLVNVYRQMVAAARRALGDRASDQEAIGRALDVELSPEVRAVFDRMLASEEQIQLAEQGRSMLPLFNAADQAGMTVDEFAAYQALGKEATDEAIEDVQARTLRDLQWTRNARGREIKRLQKQAAELRREVQMDVRREVMSQPLYRAWTFLTGKVGEADRLTPQTARKSDPNVLDETQDSLFTAIAKLGGLSKDEVMGTWGTDPADKPASGVFGKPVWRVEGGRTIDDMAQALGEAGYLTLDENGRVDLAEFEARFDSELRGSQQYSLNYVPEQEARAGDQVANPSALTAGRFDLVAMGDLDVPNEILDRIKSLKMTAKNGLHPDMVAEMFGFTSGDELVRALAMANTPSTEVEGLTDARMLEQYGELATPEAIERAADAAIHNEARGRFIATEANALARATGTPKILTKAARDFANQMIARLKVRNIRPGQYANAEVRAAKASAKASQQGDLAQAAAEKRSQLVNHYATRAAYSAQEEIDRGLRFLRKFESESTRKNLDPDYTDQIDALLERFDLRKGTSLRAIDKRKALADWIESQRAAGFEPDIPAQIENEAFRKSFKDMTVEEFRGLVDTVKQIEHLGRLKNKLLTAADNRAFGQVVDLLRESINENAGDRLADTRTPTTALGRYAQTLKRFWAAHIKAATWARVMDGGKDGGPVWEYFIRGANERADMETQMRSDATEALTKIMAPVFAQGKMGGKGQFFASIGRSLNREARLAIALNAGNQGNLQRLLGGEGWTLEQVMPVLRSLTSTEWQAVQAVWDHFESYRPQIAAKERRVYGKEPNWVEPQPFDIQTADGQQITVKGGYYPIKYDPQASQRAEQFADAEDAKRQLQGAFTSATTRRSFTKTRAEEVSGRPLLYTLAGMYSGVNDVIHDLSWHEWLIDTNRLLRSKAIDTAIRTKYGPQVTQQLKEWVQDIAEGERGAQGAAEAALSRLRQGVSAAGLGFSFMSAAIQITGFNQSIVRVGAGYIGRGIARYIASPVGAAREVVGKSAFMADRARTQFRELNELRNRVEGKSEVLTAIQRNSYWLMMRVQKMVDVPTWLGAYEKAIGEGNDEGRAIALADQAVRDSQGSGLVSDLSGVERGGPGQKLFTVFYSYMNTAFNLGVAQTMTAKSKAKWAADMLMIFTVPAVLGSVLKDALTPGGDDDEDMEQLARKLAAEQLSYLMGTMFIVREFSGAAKIITGAEGGFRDYSGPAGLRAIVESYGLITQAEQGEFDAAFRKSFVNLMGALFGLPAAQINRTITGAEALADDKTDNPAALLFGFQE